MANRIHGIHAIVFAIHGVFHYAGIIRQIVYCVICRSIIRMKGNGMYRCSYAGVVDTVFYYACNKIIRVNSRNARKFLGTHWKGQNGREKREQYTTSSCLTKKHV